MKQAVFFAKRPKDTVMLIAMCGFLGACGGGASLIENNPPVRPDTNLPSPPPPVTPDVFRTAEYNRNWGLEAIHAAEAYAQGYTGDGVIIGIVDYNFILSTSELTIHPSSRGRNQTYVDIYEAQIGDTVSTAPHGHAVAVTAAGSKNDRETHGVAFNATVLAVDFFSGVNSFQTPRNGIDYTVSDPWTYLVNNGARVVNKSFGYDEGDVISNPPQVSERYVLDFDTNVIAAGGLLVTSAGNNGDLEPSLSALRALDRAVSENLFASGGGYIIAGSVNEQLRLSDFSDAAGRAKEYYLVAPGEDIVFPYTDGLVTGNGTSFAAPHVTGAAAILFQKWPNLMAHDVADILFQTATDLGESGIDDIYGHGLLNLDTALKPVGLTSLALANGMIEPMVDLSIALGPAFGDAVGLRNALKATFMLDRYGRDFPVDASGLVHNNSTDVSLTSRIGSRRHWRRASASFDQKIAFNLGFNQRAQWGIPDYWLTNHNEFIQQEQRIAFDMKGEAFGLNWQIGRGYSLSTALSNQPRQGENGFVNWLVVNQRTPDALVSGHYATVTSPISKNTYITVGASIGHYDEPASSLFLPDTIVRPETTVFATRLDHVSDDSSLSLEVGLMQETGSFLGARTSGILKADEQSSTAWLRVSNDWQLFGGWHLFTELTGAKSDYALVDNSIFTSGKTVISSAFSMAVSKHDLWQKGDIFSVGLHQPFRVETAPVTLALATTRIDQGQSLRFEAIDVSLAPSGRELVFETAYYRTIGKWVLEANLAYRHQAGHIAGNREGLFLLGLKKHF